MKSGSGVCEVCLIFTTSKKKKVKPAIQYMLLAAGFANQAQLLVDDWLIGL